MVTQFPPRRIWKNSIIKAVSFLMVWTFGLGQLVPVGVAPAYAQGLPFLAAPGTMVTFSPGFAPPIIRGITVHPDNPFRFDFFVDTGDNNIQGQELLVESEKLIKYFLASLTVPDDEFWVNLSPYEEERVIPDALGQTELGRDLLAQDYMLKQITASLMYPEEGLGKAFWQRVRAKATRLYGKTEIPVDTFNKVWIIPETAVVYEHERGAFVGERYLKVMLEEDYLALKNGDQPIDTADGGMVAELIREVIIPELEREVNEGEHFANLRQIFNSVILAVWYKQVLRESLLGQIYVDQNKVRGVDAADKDVKQKIYDQYLEAFRQGVYDYIKEEYDEVEQTVIPRRYFSGGVVAPNVTREPFAGLSGSEQAKVVGQESQGGGIVAAQVEVRAANVLPAKESGDVDAAALTTVLSPEERKSVEAMRSRIMDEVARLGFDAMGEGKIVEALDLLFEKQGDQKRQTGTVYVLHPMEVALKLIQLGKTDLHLIVAGILHDIVEDTDLEIGDIASKFGPDVARVVNGVTNEDPDPGLFNGMSELEKAVEKILIYQKHVLDAIQDNEVFYIKILDLETNALALKNLSNNPQLQARLANKYLKLVEVFAQKARELGLQEKAAQYEAAIAEVDGYARQNPQLYAALKAEDHAMLAEGVRSAISEVMNRLNQKMVSDYVNDPYDRGQKAADVFKDQIEKDKQEILENARLELQDRLKDLPLSQVTEEQKTALIGGLVRAIGFVEGLETRRWTGEHFVIRAEVDLSKANAFVDDTFVQDHAMLTEKGENTILRENVGGIDFNPAMFDLEIRRGGSGIPLPAVEQPVFNMQVEGFFPVIINMIPVTSPLILGEIEKSREELQLTAL